MAKFAHRALVLSILGVLSLGVNLASDAPLSSVGIISDISVSISASRNLVKVGQQVIYTVTATNLGPQDATFVDIAFQVSPQLTAVSISCDHGISPDGPFCEYSSLPAGSTVVSTLTATPMAGASSRGRIVVTSVSVLFENSDAVDPNLGNNAAQVKTKVVGRLSQP